MSVGRVFWGVLLVELGALVGLDRMGWLPPLDVPLEYWPVILILLGLAKLVRISWLRMGAAVAAALLLGVMIMEVAHFDFLEHNKFIVGGSGDRQDLVEPCDGGIRRTSLAIEPRDAKIKIGEGTQHLLHAEGGHHWGRTASAPAETEMSGFGVTAPRSWYRHTRQSEDTPESGSGMGCRFQPWRGKTRC